MNTSKLYTLLENAKVTAIVSSTNASPIEITANSHGYATGDIVTVNGHGTNTAANGTWTVIVTGVNTFTLTGSVGNGVGGATGVTCKAARKIFVEDFKTVDLMIDGVTVTATLNPVGAISDDAPDFAATQSATNSYSFIGLADLNLNTLITGTTGIAVAGTNINKAYEANVNGLRWFSILPTAGTGGVFTIKARLFSDTR